MAITIPRESQPYTSAALQRLVSPHTVADFIANFWEQTHLHVRREENPQLGHYFNELISIDDIDHFLATICAAVRLAGSYERLRPPTAHSERYGGLAGCPRLESNQHGLSATRP